MHVLFHLFLLLCCDTQDRNVEADRGVQPIQPRPRAVPRGDAPVRRRNRLRPAMPQQRADADESG